VLYVSSELSAIYIVEPDLEHHWMPQGGEAVIGRLGQRPSPQSGQDLFTPTPEMEPSHA
jgi:hypothetical protein